MVKALIFDWFNTLARYEPPRELVHSRALREFGIEVEAPKLIFPLLAADKYFFEENAVLPVRKRSPEEQEGIYAKYEATVMAEAGLNFTADLPLKVYLKGKELFGDILDFVLFEDVIPLMKTLRARQMTIGLLTNYAQDMAPLITKLGLASYIDFVITPFDAGADKPDPKIFQHALAKTGFKTDEVIYVGDQYNVDIIGANRAGIKALLIDRLNLFTGLDKCLRISSLSQVADYI